MSTRAHLADEQPALPFRGPRPRLSAEDHARLHPEVYRTLVEVARHRVREGATRLGAKDLWETARRDPKLVTNGVPFKLDNNLVAGYARLIAARESDLSSLFEFRERRTA